MCHMRSLQSTVHITTCAYSSLEQGEGGRRRVSRGGMGNGLARRTAGTHPNFTRNWKPNYVKPLCYT